MPLGRPPSAASPRIAALNALCGTAGLVLTVTVLIPQHARLESRGKNERIIERLVRYNWARTASITASAVLTTIMLLRALSVPAAGFAAPIEGDSWRDGATRCPDRSQARLYFGLGGPDGPIADAAWEAFLSEIITPRFPDGLTVLEAQGQWRGADHTVSREATRVVEVMHEPSRTAELAIDEIADAFKTRYGQEAVMVVHGHSPVCLH